ncbi:TrkH family potassium uptake protein [Streptococcus timonensis]|jgi:potassium uptake protein, trk family|uniref:TrkH family potassium uptake protein n=1 Tax=Streptococcus timonensis TaxID=1852387 RepID=UPI00094F2219|nr:TrkH family potassium uptake protein [Streptococcus timonensis]
MNRSMIRFLLAKLLLIEAVLLLVPVAIALYYQESNQVFIALFSTIGILTVLGGAGVIIKPKEKHIYAKEGVLIVSLCWILWSFFGALPFVFSAQIPNLIDAFFEISSGFTTTGATILNDVSVLSRSLLFWRSFTHLIGGMGVLVFALAIMDNAQNSHMEVMRAEVPGPIFGKVVSKLKNTAQILYVLYLALFVLFIILYYMAGMPLYDSVVIAMGTAGTGGFTVYNDGIAHYQSSLITYLTSFGVLVFGVNFNLYYYLMLRRVKEFFFDEELRAYFLIVITATGLITLNTLHLYHSLADSFEMALFQVSNIITTTGFGYGNTTNWPLFSQFILLLLMAIGGSAGSTAGGLKIIRGLIMAKIAKNQVLSTLSPHRVLTLHVNQAVIDKDTQHKVLKYFVIYVMILISLIFIISLDNNNLMIVTSAVFSCFNNIGPILGTTASFSIFSPFSKILLAFAMIAGRLEIYPILLLFMRRTWSKR